MKKIILSLLFAAYLFLGCSCYCGNSGPPGPPDPRLITSSSIKIEGNINLHYSVVVIDGAQYIAYKRTTPSGDEWFICPKAPSVAEKQ